MDCRTFAEVQQNAGAIANLTKEKEGGGFGGMERECCWSRNCFPASLLKGSQGKLSPLLLAGRLALGHGDRCVVKWKEHGGL